MVHTYFCIEFGKHSIELISLKEFSEIPWQNHFSLCDEKKPILLKMNASAWENQMTIDEIVGWIKKRC